MTLPSVWYDTCPVCQGRGAIPCKECSGSGQLTDSGYCRLGAWLRFGETSGQERHTDTVAERSECPECAGSGNARCTGCPGTGMRGMPSFPGTYY